MKIALENPQSFDVFSYSICYIHSNKFLNCKMTLFLNFLPRVILKFSEFCQNIVISGYSIVNNVL